MSRHLYIAGVDRVGDLEKGSLRIEQALTYQIDTCSFSVKGEQPAEGEEVIVEDDKLGRLFAGIIVKVELGRTFPDKSIKVWNVDCDDYTALLDRRLVVESYENMSASDIFLDIVAKYCPGFTTNGVRSGAPVVESTGAEFEYKRPSECFRWLCDYVGWHWQPDYYKDLHFFSAEELANPAPMVLRPGGKFRFGKHSIDTQGLRNRVYVRGGTMLSDPQVVQWKADGVARIWTLPWGPHEVSLTVGEVPMTVGVENLHDEADFDYMMSFTEKYIRCSAHTPTPVEGITMALTARQDIPVITMVEDYASQAAIAKVQGGDGIYEHVISDDSLISIAAAEAAGMADLREHANPRVKGSFETEFTVPPVPVEKLVLDYAAKTKTDWEAGVLNGVEATDNGLVLESATAPNFTRASVAYKSDGTQVAANQPRFDVIDGVMGLMVEEGTTNVVADPSFENADITANWNAASLSNWSYTGAARVRDTTYKKYGSASVKCGDGTSYGKGIAEKNQGTAAHAVSAGQVWTLSFDVYATNAATQYIALIRCYDSAGNNISGTVTPPSGWAYSSFYGALFFYSAVPGANAWYRVTKQFTVPTGVAYVAISLQYYTGGDYYVWFDGVQFENKAYATSFIDGTRSPESLTIPTAGVLNPQEGTVACWVKLSHLNPNDYNAFFTSGDVYAPGPRILIMREFEGGDVNKIRVWDGDGSSEAILTSVTTLQAGIWYYVAFTWSPSGRKLYVNGVLEASNTRSNNLGFATLAKIGSWLSRCYLNGLIDDLRISSRARTDEEIADAYASEEPLPVDEWTTYKLGFDGDLTVGKGGMMESSILTPALREGETTGSLVNWEDVVPAGADIKIKTSVSTDGGLTWNEWEEAEEDSPIPGITEGMDLAGLKLKFRAILITEDTSNSPRLSSLFLNIMAEVLEPRIWQPGQIVDIRLPDRGVEGEYLIQRVTITPTWSNPSIWTFRVDYGGRLLGIADFLKALVSAQQKKRVIEPTKNVQKYIYGEETLTVGDELITATRGLPFVCGDADAICGMVVVSNG